MIIQMGLLAVLELMYQGKRNKFIYITRWLYKYNSTANLLKKINL